MERNVPKLRFKGFSDEWKKEKLDKLGVFFKGNGISKADLSQQGKPCILYGELYTKYSEVIDKVYSKTNLNIKNPTLSKVNDVIIPSSGETSIDIATASCVQQNDILLGGDLNVFRPNKANGIFISYQLNSAKRREIAKIAQGASVVHVYNEQLKKVKVKLPSLQEQERIANFLTKIDKIIEKQEEKVKNLEKYKKGMMQKIFSQEIRFKDENGEDYPEWEELTFNDILVEDLYPVPKPSEKYEKISVRSHAKGTFSSIVDKPEEVNMDTLYEVKEKQLIVNITFAWEHAIAIVKKEDENKLVSHRFPTYKFKENANYEFYGNYIKLPIVKYKLSLASPGGAGRNRVLNKKEFLKIEVPVPCIDEQMKIAKFLSDIDNIAEKEQKKLEKMRVWKKGLLQQMFV